MDSQECYYWPEEGTLPGTLASPLPPRCLRTGFVESFVCVVLGTEPTEPHPSQVWGLLEKTGSEELSNEGLLTSAGFNLEEMAAFLMIRAGVWRKTCPAAAWGPG